MLQKQFRLTTDFEFNVTRKYGETRRGAFFQIYYLQPRNYQGLTKVGIVVSNRFNKNAVVRNRIKRIYREIVRASLDKFAPNYWIVVYPRTTVINAKHEEINSDFTKVLQTLSFAR